MSELKREIKQGKPFASLEEEVYLNLQRTASLLRIKMSEVFAQENIDHFQYNILRIMRGAGELGIEIGELKNRLVIKDVDLPKLIEQLEMQKLVEKKQHLYNELVFNMVITKKGLDVLDNLEEPLILRNKVALGHIDDETLMTLNELLVLARKRA